MTRDSSTLQRREVFSQFSYKVIFLTPSYNSERTLRRCLNLAKNLVDKPFKHIFVTNNCMDRTNEIIDKYLTVVEGRRITWDFPDDFVLRIGDPYANIAIARNRLLLEARKEMEADPSIKYAFFLDDDIYLVDRETIGKLASWGADAISGPYKRIFFLEDGPVLAATFVDLLKNPPDFSRYWRYQNPVAPLMMPYFVSAGCMLISRRVIMDRRVRFWPIYKRPDFVPGGEDTSEDFGFSMLLRTLGYEVLMDGTINVGHDLNRTGRNRSWYVNLAAGGKKYEYLKFRFSDKPVLQKLQKR